MNTRGYVKVFTAVNGSSLLAVSVGRYLSGWARGLALVVASILMPLGSVQATDYYWDINAEVDGAGGATPDGAWDGINAFWNTDSAGGSGTFIAAPTTNDVICFSAGTDATGVYKVDLGGGVRDAGSVVVRSGSPMLTHGTLNLRTFTTLHVSSPTATVYAAITGVSSNLVKAGSGSLILAYTNSFAGITTIEEGALLNGVANALPITRSLFINAGTYSMNGFDQTIARLQGTNGFLVVGAKTLRIDGSSGSSNSVAITCTNGANLYIGNASFVQPNSIFNGSVTLAGGDTFFRSYRNQVTLNGKITGAGRFCLGSFGGTRYNARLTWFVLDHADNDYTGGTYVESTGGGTWAGPGWAGGSQGTHLYARSLGYGPITFWNNFGGGTYLGLLTNNAIRSTSTVSMYPYSTAYYCVMDLRGTKQTIAGLYGSSASVMNSSLAGGELTISNASDYVYSGQMGGALSLIKKGAGVQSLAGPNSYSGATTISNGTLRLGAPGSASGSLATSSSITIETGGTFEVNQTDTVTQGVDFSGAPISGAGSFTQAGTGTTILGSTNTYTGTTLITSGILLVDGKISSTAGGVNVNTNGTLAGRGTVYGQVNLVKGTLSPGNSATNAGIGTLSLESNLTFTAGSKLKIDVGRFSNSDRITVLGTLSLASSVTVNVSVAVSPVEAAVVSHPLISAGALANPEAISSWTVVNASTLNYKVTVIGNEVWLQRPPPGTIVRIL